MPNEDKQGVMLTRGSVKRIARVVNALDPVVRGGRYYGRRHHSPVIFPWWLFLGGFSEVDFAARTLTMNASCVQHGSAYYNVAAATVSIPALTNYVTIRYQRHVGGSYMNPSPSSRMGSDVDYAYFPLLKITWEADFSDFTVLVYHLGAVQVFGEAP